MHIPRLAATLAAALLSSTCPGPAAAAPAAAPLDEGAARALAKKSDCTKCHAADEKKDGPSYREIARKYRGKADAEQKLYTHVTTAPMVKIDGEEERHQMVKSKNEAEVQNLVRYILNQAAH